MPYAGVHPQIGVERKELDLGEKVILVCDVCGRPASQTVTIKVGRTNYAKDVCDTHLAELTGGARRPRPGRRRATVASEGAAAPKRRGRPPKSASSASSGNGRRRRGRPPKAQSAESTESSSTS